MGSSPRLIATGVREPGSAEFRITIYGNAGRELPPAELIASLAEFRAWIARGQLAAAGPSPAGTGLLH
jgi:hypothetical protein